jgi:hypothetical protein
MAVTVAVAAIVGSMVAVGTWIVIATGGGESEVHAIDTTSTKQEKTTTRIAAPTLESVGFPSKGSASP